VGLTFALRRGLPHWRNRVQKYYFFRK